MSGKIFGRRAGFENGRVGALFWGAGVGWSCVGRPPRLAWE